MLSISNQLASVVLPSGGPVYEIQCSSDPNGTWVPISTDGIHSYWGRPTTAVWTGSELLVWGTDRGARYDVQTDHWDSISPLGAPPHLSSHVAVWTGQDVIVWG